ncbi:MAG TPA: TauD/TfdA family dioxygenase [Alphaproteobacteria bacterium]|nr:TauD/TfdA family dioxygenase [Alphaproteobacteria bacterium]
MSTTVKSVDYQKTVLMSGVRAVDLALAPGIEVEPTGGPCGVFLRGIDLQDELDGHQIYSLISVFNHSGLMILRGQNRLTPERQCEVVEWFGRRFYRGAAGDKLAMVGDLPLQLLSNRDTRKPGKQVISVEDDPYNSATQPLFWHSDVQDYAVPPDVTVLHGAEIPPPEAGGRTHFVNMYQAFDELDDETRKLVRHMKWRPASTYATMKGVKQAAAMQNTAEDKGSDVIHPVVRTHPVTGRLALWITPGFTVKLEGFEHAPEQGEELLKRLKKHMTQPHLIYSHTWRQHDVIFWDNRCVMHERDSWDRNYLREMHRAQAGGSRPF